MNAPPLGSRWRPGLPPGVYEAIPADLRPVEVRMDVAAFVGLCERGPVGVPVQIESWQGFLAAFGQPGDGRRLPQAVWTFFANGGRTCVVVRSLHPAAVAARFALPGVAGGGAPVVVEAAYPGRWGHGVAVGVAFRAIPLGAVLTVRDVPPASPVARLWASGACSLVVGATIRRVLKSGAALTETFHHVTDVVAGDGGAWIELDAPIFPAGTDPAAAAVALQSVRQLVVDVDLEHRGLRERWSGAGLHASHPRFLATLLADGEPGLTPTPGSRFVTAPGCPPWLLPARPLLSTDAWTATRAATDPYLTAGDDRAALTGPAHVLAGGQAAIDAHDAAHPATPITLVDVPDLVHLGDETLEEQGPGALGVDTCFAPCDRTVSTLTPPRSADWPGLVYGGWMALADYQRQIVDWCEGAAQSANEGSRRIALLAPPPKLSGGELVEWRRRLASDRAAAYAPWLRVAPVEDPLAPLQTVSPCAAAAGLIAATTRTLGVFRAPANRIVAGAVSTFEDGLLPEPGFLHDTRINAILTGREGLSLMGSRTTSDDADWTHVSVRRLLDYLELQLPFDAAWAPFEPNDTRLWDRLRMTVEQRLEGLFSRGAFAGGTPKAAFFVRCGPEQHPTSVTDAGQCVALVGVAPSVPAEFLVFRLVVDPEGTTRAEALDV